MTAPHCRATFLGLLEVFPDPLLPPMTSRNIITRKFLGKRVLICGGSYYSRHETRASLMQRGFETVFLISRLTFQKQKKEEKE